MKGRKAIVLLSGGLDSATTLAVAKKDGYSPIALTFRYGQRHALEIQAAKKVAESMGVEKHVFIDLGLEKIGGSALLDPSQEIPKDRRPEEAGDAIPPTYVPARNLVMLAYGASLAEAEGAHAIYIGVTAVDYSGYPDCRPEFIDAFAEAARLGTKRGAVDNDPPRVITPLINRTKADIIRLGMSLGVDYGLTWSCYDPDPPGRPCGSCDSCRLRAKGFAEAGIPDPAGNRG